MVAKYLLSALAILIIGDLWLFTSRVLGNPQLKSTIAQRIDNLKRSTRPWIEIDLSEQHLFAWKGKEQIFDTNISSGKVITPTYPGAYNIQRKYPQDRMRGTDYDIPNVPYVLYYDRGYALHGAYWHDNFGTPVSHGCINLPMDNAKWLFDWTKIGTDIVIHE